MKTLTRSLAVAAATVALVAGSAPAGSAAPAAGAPGHSSLQEFCLTGNAPRHGRTFFDLQGTPSVFDIERETLKNPNYRTAAWTGTQLQVTLMSIPPGGEVGLEVHPDTDQFFRVESGTGQFQAGTAEALDYVKDVTADDVMLVPQGTRHNVVNTGTTPLKLYVLYGPAHRPACTVHPTAADSPDHGEPTPDPQIADATEVAPFAGDPGASPLALDITATTDANPHYRQALWTGSSMQLTAMTIPVGGEVGAERHADVDQFFRVESGRAEVYFGTSEDDLRPAYTAKAGDAILIPAGTWHNVVNASPKEPLKLYSLYARQPPGGRRGPDQGRRRRA